MGRGTESGWVKWQLELDQGAFLLPAVIFSLDLTNLGGEFGICAY